MWAWKESVLELSAGTRAFIPMDDEDGTSRDEGLAHKLIRRYLQWLFKLLPS